MPTEEEIDEGMADPPPLDVHLPARTKSQPTQLSKEKAEAAKIRLQKVLKFWQKKLHRSFEKKIL